MKTKTSRFNFALTAIAILVGWLSLSQAAQAQVTVTATAGVTGPTVYTTVGAAFTAINGGTHQGAITIGITANTTETAAAVLNSSGAGSASYTSILMRPTVDGVVIAGPTVTGRGLIELNGADNVTIDGDNPNSAGTNRNLTIQNTAVNTVAYNSVIRVALATTIVTSADNDTFRNLILLGNATGRNISTATSTTGSENASYGILATGGASTVAATTAPTAISSTSTTIGSGATASNLTIQNNAVTNAARAIAVQGSATTVFPGLLVENNTVGNPSVGAVDGVYSMGVTAQGSSNAIVRGNTVNVESFVATEIRGLDTGGISASGSGFTFERNMVNRVQSNSTGGRGAYGINIASANGHTIRNNFISGVIDVPNATFSTQFGAFGIRIASGTGHFVYHNSVNMYGNLTGSTGAGLTAAFSLTTTSLTGIDARNNVFVNTQTETGAATPASSAFVSISLPSGATSAMNLTLNNNDYYNGVAPAVNQGVGQAGTTAGTGFYTQANFDPTTTTPATNLRAYTSTLSAGGTNDNASKKVDPQFVSSTNLHIAVASPMVDMGASVGVTTDIDGQLRVGIPDIGADEPSGTTPPANDIAATAIVTPGNGSSLAQNAVVSPQASFTNAGTATQTNVMVQFTITGPGGYTYANTQTIASIAPNQTITVTFSPAPAFSTPGTYTTTATVTTPDQNAANDQVTGSFTVLAPLAGGTYNVPGDYPSLTNAGGIFAALNAAGASGNIVINIAGDLAGETGANALNELVGGFTVLIRPTGAARTISGTTTALGLIILNGADNVTIDGSLSGGTDRSLTVVNSNTGAADIWIRSASASNGANGNTVKNCVLNGPAAKAIAGVLSGGNTFGTAADAPNSNNTLQNNLVTGVQNAFFLSGNAATFDQNWLITGNTIGSTVVADKLSFRGMLLGGANNFTISQNVIMGVVTASTSTTTGIQLSANASNGMIVRNSIADIKNTNTTGYGANGIFLAQSATAANVTVANNFIRDVAGYGFGGVDQADNGYGIVVASGGGYNIFFNSVSLTTNQTATGSITSAVNILAAVTTAASIDLRDNILSDQETVGTRYGVINSSTQGAAVFADINYNDYFAQNVGRQGTTTYTTLANWQGATGRDANSKAVDPLFVSATDLHLTQASPLNGMATPIAGITTDFDGETRSATAPDIGADEIAVAGSVQFASPTYSVNEGAGTVTVMVTRTGGSDGAVSVNFATADGTATSGAGNDYIAQTGTVTFAAGDTTPKNIMISIIDDSVFEGNEDFSVNLSNPMGGATLGSPASTTVTIVDNDTAPTVQFSSATYSVNENAGPATLTVTLSGASALPASVNYSTADGTATSPADYNAASGTVTFAAGETSKTINITINDDATFEGNEDFSVSLSNPSGATLGSPSTATVTIIDNDVAPLVQFSAANYDVNEGAGTVTVTVTKTGNTTLPATVNYATSDGTATAPADYTSTAGTLTFAPGDTSKTFTVPIAQDTIYEGNEMFNVTLSVPVGASLGAPNPATVTILDDDTAPSFTIDSVSQAEGNGGTTPFVFTVTKTGSTSLPATVQFATADGTATTADNDYAAQSGTLTFAPGDTTMTITVQVTGDTKFEPNETFTVDLANATNATIASGTGTGTIQNDDASPTFTISDVTQNEGNTGQTPFVFTVTKTGSTALTSTVQFATADGTATTADGDYAANSGTLTFAPGDTTMQITVQVNGDTIFEPVETFTVNLANATNATIATGTGTGTILNDDAQPTFTISNVSQNEGNSGTTPFVFTVTKNGLSGQSSTVDYATVDGTATTADNDYAATSGTLTFGPNDTTMTITVQVTGDTKVEPDETFTVQLNNIMNNRHERIDGSVPIVGTGTIVNDDVAPTAITVTPAVTPTATDNDYTRINNAVQTIANNGTITLNGNFNWTEPNAAASWAAGSDGTPGTLDDYSILVRDGLSGVTFTASSLGAASIQGPGDIPTFDLEGVFFFDGGTNTNWTISNIRFLDFDLTIGMFYEPAGTNNFAGTHIVNNFIRMAVDADTPGDSIQNLGILYSFGVNQLISGNTIDIPGNGIGGSEVAVQSNSGGGTFYDGLQITNNTIHILNAQSATPEFILGIWENGNSSSSNITISGNTFVNQGAGNDPALNSQLGFEATSHSSATSTVLYSNNTVSGANQAMDWYPGLPYANYLPVQVTNNTFTGNANGVLVQSQGQATLTNNTITGIGATGTGVRAIDGLTTVDLIGTTISGTGTAVSVDATNSNSNPITMRITNSTLSGNTAPSGGALNATGTAGQSNTTITNSTLTGNSPSGHQITLQDASLTVGNSIFNTKPPGANISASGTSLVTSVGYNLSSDNFQGFLTAAGDQTNKDAILGPLKNNGGPTFTHAPLTGSPAIDQGKDFGPVGPSYTATGVDQRGFARPQTYNDPSITPPAGGDRSDIGAVELAPGVTPLSAASRKVHGAAGTFDIPLSLSGPVEIECRSGGASGVYQLVLTFATPVTFNSAVVTSGTGMVTGVSSAATTVTIDLGGVTNLQRLTVALLGVNDGSNSGDVGVRVGIVLGDTTGNGAVGSSDVSQAKAQSGQPVATANFRNDVNANGAITSSDIGLIKSQSGAVLPPVPAEPTREEQ